jgi:glutathione S-transferase
MPEIILHHYPQSPVAEKVRVGLGIKGLAWASVEIPRIPPKPLLMPLTGGYRRTPVMQIGADIYCDSQCILREIERRHPEPTLYPGGADGMAWGVSRWTDGELFTQIIKLVLGAAGDALPPDFTEDRGRLYLGADWAEGLKRANADLPHIAAQMRRGCPMRWPITWCGSRADAGRADPPSCPSFRRWKPGKRGSRPSVTAPPPRWTPRRHWRPPMPPSRQPRRSPTRATRKI